MDEPLSNLDALLRVQMRTELLQLHRRVGRTTIYVTHDQVEAMTMADRIVVMRDGVIQQIGSPARGVRASGDHVRGHVRGQPAHEPVRGHHRRDATTVRVFQGVVTQPVGRRRPSGLPDGSRDPRHPAGAHLARRDRDAIGDRCPGTVALVENVGADAYLSVSVGEDETLWVRTSAQTSVTEGAPVALRFDAAHIRWFDAAGHRITQERS